MNTQRSFARGSSASESRSSSLNSAPQRGGEARAAFAKQERGEEDTEAGKEREFSPTSPFYLFDLRNVSLLQVSIKDEHHRLIQDLDRLEKQNEQLRDRLERVQDQATKALQDKSKLREELDELLTSRETSKK